MNDIFIIVENSFAKVDKSSNEYQLKLIVCCLHIDLIVNPLYANYILTRNNLYSTCNNDLEKFCSERYS